MSSNSRLLTKSLRRITMFLKGFHHHFTPRIFRTSSNGWVLLVLIAASSIVTSVHLVLKLEEHLVERKKLEVVESLVQMPGNNIVGDQPAPSTMEILFH
jgi:hypothetical protein